MRVRPRREGRPYDVDVVATLSQQELAAVHCWEAEDHVPRQPAMTEFRRASNELKATFDREMKTLERETESIKEEANKYYSDTYNYDYSSYDSGYYGSESHDSTATEVATASASAIEGAQSQTAATAPEGTDVTLTGLRRRTVVTVDGTATAVAGKDGAAVVHLDPGPARALRW